MCLVFGQSACYSGKHFHIEWWPIMNNLEKQGHDCCPMLYCYDDYSGEIRFLAKIDKSKKKEADGFRWVCIFKVLLLMHKCWMIAAQWENFVIWTNVHWSRIPFRIPCSIPSIRTPYLRLDFIRILIRNPEKPNKSRRLALMVKWSSGISRYNPILISLI